MSLNFNIKIEKKDLWLLAAIVVFLVGVAYVIAFNPNMRSGNPPVMGHSAGEIMVENKTGSLVSLQTLIDQGGLGGGSCSLGNWIDVTAATSGGATQGPVTSDGFVTVVARGIAHGAGDIQGFTDSNNPPITRHVASGSGYADVHMSGFTMPVKKGDYWRLAFSNMGSISVYWIPLNCLGGSSGVKVETGIISHGEQIPLPSGYTQAQCKWTVSLRSVGRGDAHWVGSNIYADANRVVTVDTWDAVSHWYGTANYIIICQ